MLDDQSAKEESFRQLQAEKDAAEATVKELNKSIEQVN